MRTPSELGHAAREIRIAGRAQLSLRLRVVEENIDKSMPQVRRGRGRRSSRRISCQLPPVEMVDQGASTAAANAGSMDAQVTMSNGSRQRLRRVQRRAVLSVIVPGSEATMPSREPL
jgi:hypothetical protein